ncbi:hypothetical protein D3C76_1577250 [compost metagenome]
MVLVGLEPSTSEPPDDTRVRPEKAPISVISRRPDEALARNGAEPFAVFTADTKPARSVVATLSATEYGVVPSVTVKVSGVTS